MNSTNPQEVFVDSEDYQSSLISPYNPQDNNTVTISSPRQDATHNDNDNISTVSSSGQVAERFPNNEEDDANNVTDACYAAEYRRSSAVINGLLQTNSFTNPRISVHPAVFFFRPPSDYYHYHINCEEISCDTIECLLNKSNNTRSNENEYILFYQQKCDNRFYRVSCEIVSPLLVNNCLNKNFLGFELQQQNTEQDYLAFTIDRKEKLQHYLKQYLSLFKLNK